MEPHARYRGTTRWDYIDEVKNHRHGNICHFPDCGELITDNAKYCHEHAYQVREWKRSVVAAAKRKHDAEMRRCIKAFFEEQAQ